MSKKYYKSIKEISLYNWTQICSGDLKYILVNETDFDKNISQSDLEQAWNNLYDNFLKERGQTRHNLNLYRELKALTILTCDYIITGEQFKLTQIEIQNEKIELLKRNNTGISTEKSLVYLSKWLSYRLNWKEISVYEYYVILEEYGKANQK